MRAINNDADPWFPTFTSSLFNFDFKRCQVVMSRNNRAGSGSHYSGSGFNQPVVQAKIVAAGLEPLPDRVQTNEAVLFS